ncbi:MAG TPA: TIGR03960 family B12-binding radical SAM protein [Ruminococcaceae bacterium]|nr:TIGR03960 family B12-binding radical SAM protein [Oscillospiraceae bacterium]
MPRFDFDRLVKDIQKPGRYAGGEPGIIIKDPHEAELRFAFAFPDTYEVGMSYLGMKILCGLLNKIPEIWCERVFAPWPDMEQAMRRQGVPLFALESRDFIRDFDIIGFSLQYELSYTNVLNMLDLAGIPLRSDERRELKNLVIAGGPCVCNPEPIADFIDLFLPGEGEEVLPELTALYLECKRNGTDKLTFLKAAAKLEGVYVPSLYKASYFEDGRLKCIEPLSEEAPMPCKKRIIRDMDKVYYPETFVLPYIEIVHDRAVQEIFRGCIRGCRFCQAGFIYRPVREKSSGVINTQARRLCESTGYDEVSLSSLSTSDYSEMQPLLTEMLGWSEKEGVSISLPSLRIDNFPKELMEKVQKVRKSSLTFAPEAGTQRMRDAINKNITEEDILSSCKMAFANGYTAVKLYFMIGLPGETDEDIEGIAALAQKIVDLYYASPDKPKGKAVKISVGVSSFVPKPFTPFQWEPQDTKQRLAEKQALLISCIKSRKISLSWHDAGTSFLEAVFARGDRRLGAVLQKAFEKGCKFDGWGEYFFLEKWMEAFAETGIDPAFYANRRREPDETLPWDHMDYYVDKRYLLSEYQKSLAALCTKNCREECGGCGAARLEEGICVERRADLV